MIRSGSDTPAIWSLVHGGSTAKPSSAPLTATRWMAGIVAGPSLKVVARCQCWWYLAHQPRYRTPSTAAASRNIPTHSDSRGEGCQQPRGSGSFQSSSSGHRRRLRSNFWPSTPEALAFLELIPTVRQGCLIGGHTRKTLRTPASTAGAMWFLFQHIDSDDADAFFERLHTGVDLPADSPVLRLREFMFREVNASRRVGRPRLQAYYIKCWNAWREGKSMTQLKWKVGGAEPEKFPVPS